MDRPVRFDEQLAFHATSRREGEGVETIEGLGLVPAAFAPYRDLARLRHDFPLVLVRDENGPGAMRTLTALVDSVLRELAPRGMAGERLRKQALRLEREIRAASSGGSRGLLSALWWAAAEKAAAPEGPEAEEVLRYTASALALDGEVVACDRAMPARLLAHAWEEGHAAKARAFRKTVDALCTRLDDILRAAFIHSAAGASPQALRASVGSPGDDEFDFEAMSRLVGRNFPRDELPPPRRERIEWALATLRAQRFYPDPRAAAATRAEAHVFRFADCDAAVEAFRARMPELLATVKAIALAEIEAEGRYDARHHDAFFEEFDAHSLGSDDLALFPSYLVCLEPGHNADATNASLMDLLSSGLPFKVLVETGDALEEAAGAGRFAFGVRASRLAMTATTLGGVFVLQAPASNLPALAARVAAGLAHPGPTLFSVFAGPDEPAADLPPYLTAAAAMRSRAFPSFSYDPLAGGNLAERFSFENNPEPEADWPVAALEYSDEAMQRVVESPAFTYADFALCDRRYAAHFARVPRDRWNADMVPVDRWLTLPAEAAARAVPYLLAVDGENVLHRVIVDARLMRATRRCLTLWHRLQEMGGIHNAYAERAVAREKAAWEARAAAAPPETGDRPGTVPATPSAAAPETTGDGPAPGADGKPWIETSRCPSCNECQLINDKLFLYNENKQAYLGDLNAGTYRQMVEAAEACQVSIIHPGKPWNPAEAGLEELVERAQPFQ
jgi:hypothetical protein